MRIACFGDTIGLPQLLEHLPVGQAVVLVAAEIRPYYVESLRDLARDFVVPLLIQPRKNSAAFPVFLAKLRALKPDLILVNSYSMLLPLEVLSIPPWGAINIHGALLPQYRGCNPIQWALSNNEQSTGVTMHYMDCDFDSGDIIAQKNVPILFEDTWVHVQQRICAATDQLLAEQVPLILSSSNSRVPQDVRAARYWRRRGPEDGLFDWNWSALRIYNLIRALVFPHPGAFYINEEGTKQVMDCFVPYQDVCVMQKSKIGRVIE